jgi:hypothetical protein
MEKLSLIVGIIASCTSITAFTIYNIKYIFQDTKPNLVSWFLWAGLATLNFFSYNLMSGNFIVSLLSLAGSIMCSLTFVVYLIKGVTIKKGSFKLDKVEYWVLAIGLLAILVWILTKFVWSLEENKSAMWTNFLVLFAVSIGFVTTYRGVLRNPKNEPSLPWFIWTTAFFLQIIVVILAWDGKFQNFVYPVSMTILHLGVAIISLKK